MSVLGKKWVIKNTDSECGVLDKIRENRGLKDPDDLREFLNPDLKDLHNPFLFNGMQNAVERVEKAIKKNERIIIYGDYDVDGISGSAILYLTLQHLGGQVSYRLPHRVEDGYGLNDKFINEFEKIGIGLVITVDCGISNYKQVELAKEKGIDVIITDHHTIPLTYPEAAYEVLHPCREGGNYPFKGLTGAGVAFKFAQALLMRDGHKEKDNELIFSLLDLASLGTVADLGPLVGENRLIVKKGLELLPNTKWEGLKFLQEIAGVKNSDPINSSVIGFQIAPRINAAGRIDSPYYALQLLIQGGNSEAAQKLAKKLEDLNRKRQDMLHKAVEEAEKRVHEKFIEKGETKIIIEYDKYWHSGIIGLIAGKLAEKYTRPAIIMQDFGDYLVASARSTDFFNIIEAITKFSKYLDHFGGHAQAAGFNIKKDNLENFIKEITTYTDETLKDTDLKPTLSIDCEIKTSDINWDTVGFIESLAPFGTGNENPVFLMKNVTVRNARSVGRDNKHMSLELNSGTLPMRGIAFNMGKFKDYTGKRQTLDLVFRLETNQWNNNKTIQLNVIDFK
ncbi:single-stranded-DNA-specific exonuclease RecJ [Candidatus Peregrinibacteria bacterium]|nr:single-stranded-DNA-specific exonuclease RecJ [Candidatus Peregrinibacteria bacterium]